METKIIPYKYHELIQGHSEMQDCFTIKDNFESSYNLVSFHLQNNGYKTFRENEMWSRKIFEEEIQKIFNEYFLYPGIVLYERRKGFIVPNWLVESDKIMFGAFKNAGEDNKSGFLIKSNNSNLVLELEKNLFHKI